MTKSNSPVDCLGQPVQKLVDHSTLTNLASSSLRKKIDRCSKRIDHDSRLQLHDYGKFAPKPLASGPVL